MSKQFKELYKDTLLCIILIFAKVKFICFLLSFYIILLALKPCCAETHLNIKGEKCSIGQIEKDCSKNPDCKECSPFFSCGSCIEFMMFANCVTAKPFVQFTAKKLYSNYKQAYIQEIYLSFWQPPKIS